MTIGILSCIIVATVAPLLLAIHWIQANLEAVTLASKLDVRDTYADVSRQLPNRPCQTPLVYPNLPYCNSSLSKEERVDSLLNLLTIEEKLSLLGHDSPAVNRPGVYLPAYKWWNEGLHGLASQDCCPPHQWENVTVFPQVIGLAMTLNRSLWNEVGNVIGTEAVQKRNHLIGDVHPGLTYFTPNINIFRDPRWGRGQETPGEDPYLTSHYAAVLVMALQYGSEVFNHLQYAKSTSFAKDPNYKQILRRPRITATCKHFAAYSLETNRYNFSANVNQRDWDDTYLPAFDACIRSEQFLHNHFGVQKDDNYQGAGSLGVMCSYNAVNQTPACVSRELLSKLREDWNFLGYIVSDCWAIANIYEHHQYAKSYEEAVGLALRAGVDLDCGDTIQNYGMKALEQGFLAIEDVDRALTNLFGVLFDVEYFDDSAEQQNKEDYLQLQSNDEIAFEAALQSIVLLKNGADENSQDKASIQPLPLSVTKHTKVTVIGPLANIQENLLGNYHGIPSNVITPLKGLEDYLCLDVVYVPGYYNVTDDEGCENNDELELKFNAGNDATILVMGLDQTVESEGIDRTTLLLPQDQRAMIEHSSRCSKLLNPDAPVILVVLTGGPVDISEYKASDNVDAILYTSYLGQAGGKALAHVLYGKYNPSGRLVTTLYPNSYLDKIPLQNMNMRADDFYPGRTYRFFDSQVVYPFGYGLSYTTWSFSIQLNISEEVNICVKASNVGSIEGSTSVLLFHTEPNAGLRGNPIKSLIGFEKVHVLANHFQHVVFKFNKSILSVIGEHVFTVGPNMKYVTRISIGQKAST